MNEPPYRFGRFSGLLRRGTMSAERRSQVSTEIILMSVPSFEYYLLTMVATVTAAYGLLADSTAVIIGAMLLAPLMGPIFGIALGIANADEDLLLKALRSEFYGVLGAIALSWFIGLWPYRPDFGANILARTTPTIYDLMIACAAGVGGAFGIVNPRVSASLPGVAIAVALLPPLATVGLCLADGWWVGAGGALILFLTNLLAIALMATLVFYFTGLSESPHWRDLPRNLAYRSFSITLALLLGIGLFLFNTLVNIVQEQQLEHRVKSALTAAVAGYPGAELSEIRTSWEEETLRIATVLLVNQVFSASQVAEMEKDLIARLRMPVHLLVRSLVSEDHDRSGPVYLSPDLAEQDAAKLAETETLRILTQTLQNLLLMIPGAELESVRWREQGGGVAVTAIVRTPVPIAPQDVASFEPPLSDALDRPVELIIRSTITRDADARRYVYDIHAGYSPLALALRSQINDALRTHLLLVDSSLELKELNYGILEDRLKILARIEGPRIMTPDEVEQVEMALRVDLSAAIDLAIRSEVAAEVHPAGFDADPMTMFLRGASPERDVVAFPAPPLATDILASDQ